MPLTRLDSLSEAVPLQARCLGVRHAEYPAPLPDKTRCLATDRADGTDVPGSGVLFCRDDRVLTAPGLAQSRWRGLDWMRSVQVSYHSPASIRDGYFQSAAKGQEFVIAESPAVRDRALRNGAAFALATAPERTCRGWARTIRTTWPDLDGLWAPSTMTGNSNVVLWNPARTSLPASPDFSRSLAEPTLRAISKHIAREELGYRLIRTSALSEPGAASITACRRMGPTQGAPGDASPPPRAHPAGLVAGGRTSPPLRQPRLTPAGSRCQDGT